MGKGKSLSFFERNLIAKKRAMGASARHIARDLFRSASAIAKVIRGAGGNGAGRPRAITPRAERAFTQHVERLQRKADAQYEVNGAWRGRASRSNKDDRGSQTFEQRQQRPRRVRGQRR